MSFPYFSWVLRSFSHGRFHLLFYISRPAVVPVPMNLIMLHWELQCVICQLRNRGRYQTGDSKIYYKWICKETCWTTFTGQITKRRLINVKKKKVVRGVVVQKTVWANSGLKVNEQYISLLKFYRNISVQTWLVKTFYRYEKHFKQNSNLPWHHAPSRGIKIATDTIAKTIKLLLEINICKFKKNRVVLFPFSVRNMLLIMRIKPIHIARTNFKPQILPKAL